MRIFKHGEGHKNPSRDVTKKEAKRALQANAKGKPVDSDRLRASKLKAKDHYATEVDKANRGKS